MAVVAKYLMCEISADGLVALDYVLRMCGELNGTKDGAFVLSTAQVARLLIDVDGWAACERVALWDNNGRKVAEIEPSRGAWRVVRYL